MSPFDFYWTTSVGYVSVFMVWDSYGSGYLSSAHVRVTDGVVRSSNFSLEKFFNN